MLRNLIHHPVKSVLFTIKQHRTMSGLALKSVVETFNHLAPLSLAESWDNVGLLVEPSSPKIIRKIMLTNDLTQSVMQEAMDTSVDLIYSYHPPIFASMKRICTSNWKVMSSSIVKKICLIH